MYGISSADRKPQSPNDSGTPNRIREMSESFDKVRGTHRERRDPCNALLRRIDGTRKPGDQYSLRCETSRYLTCDDLDTAAVSWKEVCHQDDLERCWD